MLSGYVQGGTYRNETISTGSVEIVEAVFADGEFGLNVIGDAHVILRRCKFFDNEGNGARFSGNSTVIDYESEARRNGKNGFACHGNVRPVLNYSKSVANKGQGFLSAQSVNGFEWNYIYAARNGKNGAVVGRSNPSEKLSQDWIMRSPVTKDNKSNGISADPKTSGSEEYFQMRGVIDNPECRGNHTHGMFFSSVDGIDVTGGRVVGNRHTGVYVANSANVNIENLIARKNIRNPYRFNGDRNRDNSISILD